MDDHDYSAVVLKDAALTVGSEDGTNGELSVGVGNCRYTNSHQVVDKANFAHKDVLAALK